ncbi:MAG: hypothetical protein H0Z37_10470 [Firmicutes bacterium]|nr:hypothetical protein [Bacillota bacterium]
MRRAHWFWSMVLLIAAVMGPWLASYAQEAYEVNLLQNSSFELGGLEPQDWRAEGAALARRDSSASWDGRASGKLFVTGEEREAAWRQGGVQLVSGGRYILSGWVRTDNPAVALLGIEWPRDPDAGGHRIHRGIPPDGKWHRVEMEFVASRSGPAVAVAGGVLEGSLWWDGLSLARVDDRPQQLAARWERLIGRYGHVYTGLVVDARGLGVRRGMAPRIVDDRGNLVYAGMEANPRLVITRGIVSYARDLDEALRHPRLAVSEVYPYRVPLLVTAVARVDDPFQASVVVSGADADRIRRELEKYDFLGRYAVVFVID